MAIRYSRHARERMIYRDISRRDIKEAIMRGSIERASNEKMFASYKYFTVVYKKTTYGLFVITVKPRSEK